MLELCEFSVKEKWKLVYRASEHGFGYENFHEKCADETQCLTIVQVENGNIFGDYIDRAWNKQPRYMTDKNSFLFSLINKENKPLKMKCSLPDKAAIGSVSFIQVYGHSPTGTSLALFADSNQNTSSQSDLGDVFKHPTYSHGSAEAQGFLAGSKNFKTREIEIYCKQ